ncbi:hypothetical protein O6072_15885 [Mycolicibacterium neoaurum]|uniref:hypothetical protein n=1 Tax=Mycolicibacterium neoaurum TaxID=1795 RepID=UPI00248AE7EC|nr:hypothetical protein [Mycolicibacterium neoaurum]WBP92797.1 hypothetical protein O7W24_16565 [Mycolicibacterium neoaurum]WBS06359.1 hypothetical protein O6072_15885 [Mycolicibacterium neoaurum]
MSNSCISGRHDYDHLGTSCDQMDDKLRTMRDIALRRGTSIVSPTGPTVVWDANGNPVRDAAVVPDSVDRKTGNNVYKSGSLGPASDDDDAQDD